ISSCQTGLLLWRHSTHWVLAASKRASWRPSLWSRLVVIVCDVDAPFGLIEFPADDPDRARGFWSELLDIELVERSQADGRGWQTQSGAPVLGVHERGVGLGDMASLLYFTVLGMEVVLEKVIALGGNVIHPGPR